MKAITMEELNAIRRNSTKKGLRALQAAALVRAFAEADYEAAEVTPEDFELDTQWKQKSVGYYRQVLEGQIQGLGLDGICGTATSGARLFIVRTDF